MKFINVDESSLSGIRKHPNSAYVDKTRQIYNIFRDGKYFFISRPRRFGKSLLCSTLAALFANKRSLFTGTWIDQSDWKWEEYPVIHLDMTRAIASDGDLTKIRSGLASMFNEIAQNYALEDFSLEASDAVSFENLIRLLHHKTGKPVVIIIDEYDKPLLEVVTKKDLYEPVHALLRDVYSQLKASTDHLKLVFLTGVFKFTKTSVFSGLNNIKDITFDLQASDLLGYTEEELKENFSEHIEALGAKLSKTPEAMLETLREKYNGYRFGVNVDTGELGIPVYNPFALNNVLQRQQMLDRWFQSGTPTLLVNKLKEESFRGIDSENLITRFASLDASSGPDHLQAIHLLYYAGYVTLKQFEPGGKFVSLDFPNIEVAQSMADLLLPYITSKPENTMTRLADRIRLALIEERINDLKDLLNLALTQLPYHMFGTQESYYQTVIYLLLAANNMDVFAEDLMNRGRADLVVLLPGMAYIFELKLNQPANKALEQIKLKGYTEKYKGLKETVYAIGVELCSDGRGIKDLLFEKCSQNTKCT